MNQKIMELLKKRNSKVEKDLGIKIPKGFRVTSSYGQGEEADTIVKKANRIMDQYDDVDGIFMEKLANAGVVISPREDVHELPDKDFALIIEMEKRAHRKFPVGDLESTILSANYFMEYKDQMPEDYVKVAGAKIKEACFKHNLDIPDELQRFELGMHSNRVKEASIDNVSNSSYEPLEEVNGEIKLRVSCREDVIKAIAKFPQMKEKLSEEHRKRLRDLLSAKADKYKVDFGIKTASINPSLLDDMKFRVRHLDESKQKPYIKLAHMVLEKKASLEEGKTLINRLDKQNNYQPKNMPAESVLTGEYPSTFMKTAAVEGMEFFMMKKTAAVDTPEKLQMLFQNNRGIQLQKRLEEQFDKDLVAGLKQDPETVFNSLPNPHQEMIEAILSEINQ